MTKSFPWASLPGAGVFVCDNLAFSGEIDVFRRHTRFMFDDLPGKVSSAIGGLNALWANQDAQYNAYKGTPIASIRDVDYLLGEAYRNDAMPYTYGKAVMDEWLAPSHEEFAAANVWRLFNAFTEKFKEVNVGGTSLPHHAIANGTRRLLRYQLGAESLNR